jgi:biotin transport system substrate-specific component
MTTLTASRSAPAHLRYTIGVPLFALAAAAGAHVVIPLPGTPVPMTLQTLPVLLAPVMIGAAPGALAMAIYLTLGLCGLPVFSDHAAGAHVLVGPTAGYLVGFLLAQPLAAGAMGAGAPAWQRALAAVVVANVVIFTAGVLWLGISLRLSPANALAEGLWPFLAGDLVKSAVAVAVAVPFARR